MGLLVSNPDVNKPCDCGTSKCQTAFTYSAINHSGSSPFSTKLYPTDPNGTTGNETGINQYGCCNNLWQMWARDNQVYPGQPLMDVTYTCQWATNVIGNFIFTVFWGESSQQETIYQETWAGILFIGGGGEHTVTLGFQNPNWVRYPAQDSVFQAYRWLCPTTVAAKAQPHVYYSLDLIGLPADLPFNTITFWPVGGHNTGVIFPNLEFYNCPSQCLKLSVSFGGGTPYTITAQPPPNLFNPSACCPGNNIWFVSAGTGSQPGISIDSSSSSNGQFTWTFTIDWGGNTVLTETGTITFSPSASFFIPFSDPNWKLNNPELGWIWYYSGTFNNANPIVFGLHFNGDPKLNVTHWPGATWYSCPSAIGFRIKSLK